MRTTLVSLLAGVLVGTVVTAAAQPGEAGVAGLDLANPIVVVGVAVLAVRAAIEMALRAIQAMRPGTPTTLGIVQPDLEQLRQDITRGFDGLREELRRVEEGAARDRRELWRTVSAVRTEVDRVVGRLSRAGDPG